MPTRAASRSVTTSPTRTCKANACDPISAFGGIVAVNRTCHDRDGRAARPRCSPRWSSRPATTTTRSTCCCRRRTCGSSRRTRRGSGRTTSSRSTAASSSRSPTRCRPTASHWRVVTDAQPTDAQWDDLEFAWLVCAAVSSNAIVYAKDLQSFGIGAGQQNRVDSARIAADTCGGPGRGRRVRQRCVLPVP